MPDAETKTEAERGFIGPSSEPVPGIPKVRIEFLKEPAAEPVEEVPAVDLKVTMSDKIRDDCGERGVLTSEDTLIGFVPGLRPDAISAALAEMVADPGYADIKAVTTASGLVFFYSERHIRAAEAAAKSLREEAKFRIAERVRADSRDTEILTPVAALAAEIGWDGNADSPDEIRKDPRYDDIKTVTSAAGEVFFYSGRHMSDYYALILARVAAHDPCATIADTVRDESRIYPRPTCVLFFREKLFGMNEADLRALVDTTLARPEFSDIEMLVHPSTGGVYLYSSQYLDREAAFSVMDWQEVGKDANP
jgi:hypothetical protein